MFGKNSVASIVKPLAKMRTQLEAHMVAMNEEAEIARAKVREAETESEAAAKVVASLDGLLGVSN